MSLWSDITAAIGSVFGGGASSAPSAPVNNSTNLRIKQQNTNPSVSPLISQKINMPAPLQFTQPKSMQLVSNPTVTSNSDLSSQPINPVQPIPHIYGFNENNGVPGSGESGTYQTPENIKIASHAATPLGGDPWGINPSQDNRPPTPLMEAIAGHQQTMSQDVINSLPVQPNFRGALPPGVPGVAPHWASPAVMQADLNAALGETNNKALPQVAPTSGMAIAPHPYITGVDANGNPQFSTPTISATPDTSYGTPNSGYQAPPVKPPSLLDQATHDLMHNPVSNFIDNHIVQPVEGLLKPVENFIPNVANILTNPSSVLSTPIVKTLEEPAATKVNGKLVLNTNPAYKQAISNISMSPGSMEDAPIEENIKSTPTEPTPPESGTKPVEPAPTNAPVSETSAPTVAPGATESGTLPVEVPPAPTTLDKINSVPNGTNLLANHPEPVATTPPAEPTTTLPADTPNVTFNQTDNPLQAETPTTQDVFQQLREEHNLPLSKTEVAQGTPDNVSKAATALDEHLNQEFGQHEDILGVLNKARGLAERGGKLSKTLGESIDKSLGKSESEAVRNALDTGSNDIKPESEGTANTIKNLNNKAYDIRQYENPQVTREENYVTRLAKSGINTAKGALQVGGTNIRVALNRVNDLLSKDTKFGINRLRAGFTDETGKTIYGTPRELSLAKKGDSWVSKDGTTYTRSRASVQDLENAGYKYEKNVGKTVTENMKEVSIIRARSQAVDEMIKNPDHYGIYTADQAEEFGNKVGLIHGTGTDLDGMYASTKEAKLLNSEFKVPSESGNIAVRAASAVYNRTMNFIIKDIVFNPLVHGANEFTNGFLAMGKDAGFVKGQLNAIKYTFNSMRALADRGYRAQVIDRYLNDGGHLGEFGTDKNTIGSKILGTKEINKITNLSGYTMEGLENAFRAAAYDTLTKGGMKGEGAVKTIDTFLGDGRAVNPAARHIGMFYKWLQTNKNVAKEMLGHPVANRGVYGNFVTTAAVIWGLNQAFKEWTGNNQAHIHIPGFVGIANEAKNILEDVTKGNYAQGTEAALSYTNPLIQLGANEFYGKDPYTGQPLATGKERANEALTTLIAQGNDINKMNTGKSTPLETAMNIGGGYTPHVGGTMGAPNFGKGGKGLLDYNTPNSTSNTNAVYKSTQQYYNMKANVFKGVQPGTSTYDVLNKYFDHTYNPTTGQKIQLGTVGNYSNVKDLYTNLAALSKLYNAEHALPNNDPLWSLPLNAPKGQPSVKAYMDYEGQYEGPEKTGTKNGLQGNVPYGTGWIDKLAAARSKYYNGLGIKTTSLAPNETPYPTFDKQTTADVATARSITNTTQYYNYVDAHPDVLTAQQAVTNWENNIAQLEGMPKARLEAQQPSTAVQNAINTYNALPLSKTAGNTTSTSGERSAWIKANPDLWNQMLTYYGQADMAGVIKNSIEAAYSGQNLNDQSLLKDVKNGGSDIVQNSNGSYSVNAPAASAAAYAAGGSSYKSPSVLAYERDKAAGFSDDMRLKTVVNKKTTPGLKPGTKKYKAPKLKVAKMGTAKNGNPFIKAISSSKGVKLGKQANPFGNKVSAVRGLKAF